MDHDLAIKNNTAERYLLGELTEAEIEEYEEHFFSCPACAQEVKLGSDFVADAREVFKTDFKTDFKPVPKPSIDKSMAWGRFWNSIRQPAFAFACALLIAAIGFNIHQNALIQDLSKPELLTTAALMLRASRGVSEEEVRVSPGQPIRVAFDIPKGDFSSYEVEVWNEAGSKQSSIPVPADQAKNTLQVKFRGGSLPKGNYTLVIQGVTKGSAEKPVKHEIARYPFSVNIQGQ
jgi:hypothetical protein